MDVTRQLADFVACTGSHVIGDQARQQAGRAILDTVGVTIAGWDEEAPHLVTEMVREQGGANEATVIGAGFQVPASQAALANGTAAHALDYDDVQANMRGHPSVPLVPAILALGEKLGCSGREVLDAYVVGFEVECKLGRAIGAPHYALGWHATSTLGTLGSAAACARLLRLDAVQTGNALAIAASLASGLQANFGTMTKPLHAGWAAHNGVVSADLAARGFEGGADVLEAGSGFLRAMSGDAWVDPGAAVRDLGEPWEVIDPGIGVKLHPCCYATHRSIDAVLDVRAQANFNPALIDSVDLHLSTKTTLPLIHRPPKTGLEAKFSLEYCVAYALLHGAPRLNAFTDEASRQPDVQALLLRIHAIEDGPELAYPIQGWARVVARQSDGQAFEAEIDTPRGDPARPLTWDELALKFRDCTDGVLTPDGATAVIGLCGRIDELADIGELLAAVEGGRA